MKVLLTVPMCRPSSTNLQSVEDYPYINDNGLGYVAAACRNAGADVTLWSWNKNYDSEQLRNELQKIDPNLIGIKCFTTHFLRVVKTLSIIRETLPFIPIILGGPHASTSKPEDLFKDFSGLIDFAMAGDGENGIIALLHKLRNWNNGVIQYDDLKDIPGLVYNNNGTIFHNPPSNVQVLDDLPEMDWDRQLPISFLTSGANHAPIIAYLEDSRGCPAQCGHCCSSKIHGSYIRKRSIQKVCADIENLVLKYQVNKIAFSGNGFLSDVAYTQELCHWLIKFNKPVTWICTGGSYARNLCDKDFQELLKRAGCREIQYGIESGNEKIRRENRYPLDLLTFRKAVRISKEVGIKSNGFFMFGFPGETFIQMFDTLRFAAALPFATVSFCICLPLPGTTGYEAVLEKHKLARIDWRTYSINSPSLLPSDSSITMINAFLLFARVFERNTLLRNAFGLLFPYKQDRSGKRD